MSFLRHGQIYQSDVSFVSRQRRNCFRLRPRLHRFDEFAASYSLAGWSPPEPTSALPAGFIFNQPAETFNHLLRRVAYFSTGRMGNFQPVLTLEGQGGRRTQWVALTTCRTSPPVRYASSINTGDAAGGPMSFREQLHAYIAQ